jgi:RND family efflux transporter MFP subunit
MQFLRQAMLGVLLAALSLGALGWAGSAVWRAVSVTMDADAPDRPRREIAVAVRAVTVTPGPAAPVIEAFGVLRGTRTLDLRAATGGTVVGLADPFRDGVAVPAGQVLVRIDPAEAEAALATARTDLDDAEAAQRDARRNAALAREDLAVTREQADLRAAALARQEDLDGRGVGSAAAVETAALAAAQARQAVVGRRQALAQAEAALEQATTAAARARIALSEAERRLDDTVLQAPFDGVLSAVAVTTGARVAAGELLAQVVDPAALEVSFRLSTAQFARLGADTGGFADLPVTVTLDPGTGGVHSSASDLRVSPVVAEGETGRALFARLDRPAGFRPGDIVTVALAEPPLADVAVLPAAAVGADGGVLVIGPDDRLAEGQVNIVRRQANTVLVQAGDLAGARVVADRTPALGAGLLVEVTGTEDPQPVSSAPAADEVMLDLSEPRRAALLQRLAADPTLDPADRARMRAALQGDRVPASLVRRIEDGRGG